VPSPLEVDVECRGGDPKPTRHFGNVGFWIGYRRDGRQQRRTVHLARSAARSTPGARRRQSGVGPLGHQFAFELRKRRKNAERQATVCGCGIDLSPGARQHLQADAAHPEILDRVDQMPQIAAETVQLPDHQGVAPLQRLETGGQPGTVIPAARGEILIDAIGLDTGGKQRIALRRQRLVGLLRLTLDKGFISAC
jgi:hypothetical protein